MIKIQRCVLAVLLASSLVTAADVTNAASGEHGHHSESSVAASTNPLLAEQEEHFKKLEQELVKAQLDINKKWLELDSNISAAAKIG